MRKIRLWVFFAAIWVAKKACYSGFVYDKLENARASEIYHHNWTSEEHDGYYDPTI